MTKPLILALALFLALPLCAQNSSNSQSLGDIARQNRAATPEKHAKFTLSDEDVKPKGPFPDISLEDDANDNAIATAYHNYADTHTRGEVDKAVRDWYDRQVTAYNDRRNEVAHIQAAQQASYSQMYPQYYDPNYDARKAREQSALAQAGMQSDQKVISRDQQEMYRITNALQRLRLIFDPKGTRYDWFKTNLYQSNY